MPTKTLPNPNPSRQKLRSLLIIALLSKVFVFGLIFLSYQYLPYCEACRTSNFLYPADSPQTLLSAYQTWDAQHYLYLAEAGYQPELIGSNAFSPLFPLLMRLFRPLFLGNTFLTGIVLANIFSLLAVVYFYLFVKERYYPQAAFTAGLFLLAFPTAFYLNLIYTESLFLLLVMIAFYALYRRKLGPVLAVGLLLPLARTVGLLVAVPLIFQIMFTAGYAHQLSQKLKASALVAVSFGVGFVLYLALMQYYTGSPFSGFEAQHLFLADNSISNLLHPFQWVVRNFITVEYTIHDFSSSIIDRFFFFSFLVLLYFVFRKLDLTLFVYALVAGLVPAFSDALNSFPRYMLIVFPIFIALALAFPRRHKYLIILMAIVQALFVFVQSANYWVA